MQIGKIIAKNKIISFFILLLILGFGYYFWLHRHPRTDNAFVVANIRPVSSLVDGHISKIYVVNNQKVSKGDKLFTVYRKPYELSVESFKNQLLAEKYQSASLKEKIKKSKLQIKKATAEYQNAVYLANQANSLFKTTIFIKNMDQFIEINEMYGRFFAFEPPARSCVEVARLPKDVLIEVEAIAIRK